MTDPLAASKAAAKAAPPKNYFVPNFGIDQDVKNTYKSIADQEARQGHELPDYFKKAKADAKNAPPRGYFVPNFGMDQDIKDAQSNIKLLEKAHGAWNPVRNGAGGYVMPDLAPGSSQTNNGHHFLQLYSDIRMQDDPICNSYKCTQYLHPTETLGYKLNYKVPDFGVD